MQTPKRRAQKYIMVVCPVDNEMTKKNAAESPLRPTDNPSELSIKLNAFVNVTNHKTVINRFSQTSKLEPVLYINSGESKIFTCTPK